MTELDERGGLVSASAMDMFYHCPGARNAQVGLPELPSADVTESGTAIHEARATDDHEDLQMTEREIADKLKDMEKRAFDNWMNDFGLFYPIEHGMTKTSVTREERLWIRNRVTLELIASAKPDVWFTNQDHALIIDYKTGFAKTTPSERNWQSRTQVIALWQNFPHLKVIRGAIMASRLSSNFDPTDYHLEDLDRVERELKAVIWRTEQPDAPRVPGTHCRYCRASGECREKAVYDQIASSQLPIVSGKGDQLAILEAVNRLTPAEMAFLYRRKSSLELAYDAMEHRMKALPEDQLKAIGYKLAPGNKNREIVDVSTAFARLRPLLTWSTLDEFGKTTSGDDRLAGLKLVIGKMAEALADRTKVSLEHAKNQIYEALDDTVREKIGNPRLKAL